MDAPDDRDIRLQRASADLLKEFETKLPLLLWKTKRNVVGKEERVSHRWTQLMKMRRLVDILESFQEWPQLLDPHLSTFVPQLVDAFLDYLMRNEETHKHRYELAKEKQKSKLIPLPQSISRLLYVFCKVRGVKVISGFLNNEPKYLEPMLLAFMAWDEGEGEGIGMTWEEKYVMLLWLSHLLLVPFDLSSVSSEVVPVPLSNLHLLGELHPSMPQITRSILSLCLKYVVVSAKEREAAVLLLARLVLRPDMQKLGLMERVVDWASATLNPSDGRPLGSVYTSVGVLAFIARLFGTGQVRDLIPLTMRAYGIIYGITTSEDLVAKAIVASALARKMIIKILRHIASLTLSVEAAQIGILDEDDISTVLEGFIDHCLTALADKDQPVRFAASKALSVVTLKLDPEMAAEVVDAVLGSLNEDLLYETKDGRLLAGVEMTDIEKISATRNLNAVDHLRWQGLMLTLSHLLFRRSPPAEQLPEILQALMTGLDFDQRTATGVSRGTGVRDAACFGVWALSRKYTSAELQALDGRIQSSKTNQKDISALQVLAIELMTSGCLDPSGNIRRGSSAALQELIGRHPDTILQGIPIVQAVDYHAIARRSRALTEVSKEAADLGDVYWEALFRSLLQWRGVGSTDAESRRKAAEALGILSGGSYLKAGIILKEVLNKLRACPSHAVELRHGLMVALASVVDAFRKLDTETDGRADAESRSNICEHIRQCWYVFREAGLSNSDNSKSFTSAPLRPELTAEACSHLIASLAQCCSIDKTADLKPTEDVLQEVVNILTLCLTRSEDISIQNSTRAFAYIIPLFSPEIQAQLIQDWFAFLAASKGSPQGRAQIAALGFFFMNSKPKPLPGIEDPVREVTVKLIENASGDEPIEKRVVAIKSLITGVLRFLNGPIDHPTNSLFFDSIASYLNDYTTDQRGDVGMQIRLEGINAVQALLDSWLPNSAMLDAQSCPFGPEYAAKMQLLVQILARLAGEKLDKVRFQAWKCLERVGDLTGMFSDFERQYKHMSQVSSSDYFEQLLSLLSISWLRLPLFKGFMTSAGGGADSLLCGARHGLIAFLAKSDLSSDPASETVISASSLVSDLHVLIEENSQDDRYVVPAMEVLAFVVAENFPSPTHSSISHKQIFLSTQRAHFKTANVAKIEAAIKVYLALLERERSGTATFTDPATTEILKKLCSLILHPFPKIRNTAADALVVYFSVEPDTIQPLLELDWSSTPKILRPCVETLKRAKGLA